MYVWIEKNIYKFVKRRQTNGCWCADTIFYSMISAMFFGAYTTHTHTPCVNLRISLTIENKQQQQQKTTHISMLISCRSFFVHKQFKYIGLHAVETRATFLSHINLNKFYETCSAQLFWLLFGDNNKNGFVVLCVLYTRTRFWLSMRVCLGPTWWQPSFKNEHDKIHANKQTTRKNEHKNGLQQIGRCWQWTTNILI